jgi:putative ATP-binding cassette transporter
MISLTFTNELGAFTKEYIIMLSLNILLFVWTHKELSLGIIELSQDLFWRLRKQILLSMLKSNFKQFNDRRSKIYSAIVNDVNILTNASINVIHFFTSFVLASSCFIYLALISLPLFFITLSVALLGTMIYKVRTDQNLKDFKKARDLENQFVESLNSVLDGFKEVVMDPKKGQAIYNRKIIPISTEAYTSNVNAYAGFLNIRITGMVLFYILISAVILYLGTWLNIQTKDTINFAFTLLFLLGAIESIMVLLPVFARAKIANNHLVSLRNELEHESASNSNESVEDEPTPEFGSLRVKGLKFQYEGSKPFSIGPIDIDIKRGETIFIYGGNGSGKSTLIKALIGSNPLYEGEINLNNSCLEKKEMAKYKGLFSVVFSDFYLFNEFFGVDHIDETMWKYYLELFELEGKVQLHGHTLSTTDLSTGQRKRLALIMSLMEGKQILVLDEWAADQDPYFRKKFYLEILPILKQRGMTIIAVTHDDKYYRTADKLFRMEYGKLFFESEKTIKRNLLL